MREKVKRKIMRKRKMMRKNVKEKSVGEKK